MMNLLRRVVLILSVGGLVLIFAGVFLMPFIIIGSMWWAHENPVGAAPQKEPLVAPAVLAEAMDYGEEIRSAEDFPLEAVRDRWRQSEETQTLETADALFRGYARKQVVPDETAGGGTVSKVYYYYPVQPDGVTLVATFSPEDLLIEIGNAIRDKPDENTRWMEAD